MTPLVRQARADDVARITRNLRNISIKEVERIGLKPEETIKAAVQRARYSWVGYLDDEIVCMWGLESQSLLGDTAMLWLITTPLVEKHPFHFVRRTQMFVDELMKQEFTYIFGYVDQLVTMPVSIQRVDNCNKNQNATYRLLATRGTFSADYTVAKPALVVSFEPD